MIFGGSWHGESKMGPLHKVVFGSTGDHCFAFNFIYAWVWWVHHLPTKQSSQFQKHLYYIHLNEIFIDFMWRLWMENKKGEWGMEKWTNFMIRWVDHIHWLWLPYSHDNDFISPVLLFFTFHFGELSFPSQSFHNQTS